MTVNVIVALLPVVVFLAILFLMDSFKLVPFRALGLALCAGALAALAALALHLWLWPASGLSDRAFPRYVAPFTEETLKAIYVVVALRQRRLGFLVDAAVIGFAVGTGFALVENMDYLRAGHDTRLLLWVVRGFGSAVLHPTTTALFAMLAKMLSDRHPAQPVRALVPGWLAAVALHSAYNHVLDWAIVATGILLVVLPLLITFVFERSEKATREWVGEGLDLDVELLNLVTSADFGGTRLGGYLRELRAHFAGPVVADMFCLLRIELELAIRTKGMLMAREAGLDVAVDPALKAKLKELHYLRSSIGKTGMLALQPLRVTTDRDDWHRYLLEQAGMQSRLDRIKAFVGRGRN